jgi:8-oxo-dGTP diphosphatase
MASRDPRPEIRIAAGIVKNERGETLVVRKRGTTMFMQPGGKIDRGEDELGALVREFREELGCDIDPVHARFLGRFRALAANEPRAVVDASLFRVELSDEPAPDAEIDEAMWLHPDAKSKPALAPLTEHHVMSLLRQGEVRDAPRALFICKGNWFRSQMAAAIYNKCTSSRRAHSVGTYAGEPDEPEGQILADLFPTAHFFEAMERRGMYVRANATRRLLPEMLGAYDVVVSMAEEPYVPDFLRTAPNVIWWQVENPRSIDLAKAEEMFAVVYGLVRELTTNFR